MMLRTCVLFVFLGLFGCAARSQSSAVFQRKFQEARTYLKDKDFGNAMTLFNELTYDHKKNDFVEMSHYYYALSAYNNGMYDDAKIMLSKLTSNYSHWNEIHEAYYLQGVIAYAEGDFPTGDALFQNIKGNKLKEERENIKKFYLQKIQSLDSLMTILDQDKENEFLLNLVVSKLVSTTMNGKKRMQLEYLIQDYGLKRSDYESLLEKKSVFKDSYKVAVMLPFKVSKSRTVAEPSRSSRKYYEMYTGIKIAVDSLRQTGVNIDLFAYDTKHDTTVVKNILNQPEMKSFDLIIGPIWSETSARVSEFAESSQINYVNPVSSRGNYFSGGGHTFFYKPSGETIAEKCADYALAQFDSTKTKVLIFYGDKTKDSIMAMTYKARMDSVGKEVIFKQITSENARDFESEILRLNPMDISHLFVCTEDRFVGSHIMHPLEDQDIQVPTIVPSDWLDIHTIAYTQFSRRNFHFIYNDYVVDSLPSVRSMRAKFKEQLGMPALNEYAYVGYDIMFSFGNYLYKYGTLFNRDIRNNTHITGAMSNGGQYSEKPDNQVVPLLIFDEDYEFKWVNKPKPESPK